MNKLFVGQFSYKIDKKRRANIPSQLNLSQEYYLGIGKYLNKSYTRNT